jgi:hypothetical protein
MQNMTMVVASQIKCPRGEREFFAPRWLFFKFYSHRSVMMWVQSQEPTQPGNPSWLYSCMLEFASGKLTGDITHFR